MQLHVFYNKAQAREGRLKERPGQAAFNLLTEVNVSLAEEIMGTDKDPFFAESTSDPRWQGFCAFLSEKWT